MYIIPNIPMRIDKNIRRFDIDEIIEFVNGSDSNASVFPRFIPRKTSIPKAEYNRNKYINLL
jgi:hypothetical protein